MKEYKTEDLHKLWKYEENIYLEFSRICEKHNLRYFSAYGTVLGAIRHKGFIPWDDDMDMGMPREDYEKFIKIAPKELKENFELQEARLTKGYVLPFAKLTRSDTTFIEATDTDRKYHSGIFVDIFPFDLVSEKMEERKKAEKKCWFYARLMVLCDYPRPKVPASVTGIKKSLVYAACSLAHFGLKVLRRTPAKLQDKYIQSASEYGKRHKDAHLYADFVMYNAEIDFGRSDQYFDRNTLFPAVEVPYDNIMVKVPHDWDKYLTDSYENYMELPPVEQRHTHYPSKLKFSKDEPNAVSGKEGI